jgi:hypothetical protein
MTTPSKPNSVIFIHGLWIHSAARGPWLDLFSSRGYSVSAPALNAKQFYNGFGNMLTIKESDALHDAWTVPGPGKPLFEGANANFFPHSRAKVDTGLIDRGPLLLTSGTDDHTVALKVTKEVVAMYEKSTAVTDFQVLEGRGHSLAINHGWEEVANDALGWLGAKGFELR